MDDIQRVAESVDEIFKEYRVLHSNVAVYDQIFTCTHCLLFFNNMSGHDKTVAVYESNFWHYGSEMCEYRILDALKMASNVLNPVQTAPCLLINYLQSLL